MVKINLNEFAQYDKEMVAEFITLLEETEFEIVIPKKSSPALVETHAELMEDYMYAAYAGDLISRVVKFFAYYTPDPFSEEAIWFRVLVENRDEFIDALYEIIYCFYFDEHGRGKTDDPQYISYVNAVFSFYENSLEFKEPCNTWGLIYVAKALVDDVYETDKPGEEEDDEDE